MVFKSDGNGYAYRDPVEATAGIRQSPVHEHIGLTLIRQGLGHAVLTMDLSKRVQGFAEGSVHGGMLATLADAACAVSLEGSYDLQTEIPVTTDMHNRFYRQPRSGPLTAEATMAHRGRRLLSSECSITDAEERVLVRSTATYMIIPIPDPGAGP